MISVFIKEQQKYSSKELCHLFHCTKDKMVTLIRKLKEFGILKVVKGYDDSKDLSELLDSDFEDDTSLDDNSYFYTFTFVGVIVVSEYILKCYPKYICHFTNLDKELKQILKVLEKYGIIPQTLRMLSDSEDSASYNLLATILFLIQDYFENGLYDNQNIFLENNGSGEILWDNTINEFPGLIYDNRPYYFNFLTKAHKSDNYDFFKHLHECILTQASNELKRTGLLDLLDITEVNLSDDDLSDLGEEDYLLYRLETELNNQFVTRKQILLKTLYSYILHSKSICDSSNLSLFGTNSFNLVWEKICAEVFDNQLNVKLGELDLPKPLDSEYDKNKRLIEIVEKPFWSITGKEAIDTLIPDLITIKDKTFFILDAKYYNPYLVPGEKPKFQPGIESVSKQYFYQLAYQKFACVHGFKEVKNCFLMPTESSHIEDKGEVTMEIFKSLGINSIKVRLLPARIVYDYYLAHRTLDTSFLNL